MSKAPLTIPVIGPDGKEIKLKDFLGKYVVIYFYPKDNTPGCTVEACSFRDAYRKIQKLDAVVLGVSKDGGSSHEKFAQKFNLPFTLLSDPDHTLIEAFGAWAEKNMMGRKYMGIIRKTFILDPKGKIIKTWEKVKPEGHADEVYAFLKEHVG